MAIAAEGVALIVAWGRRGRWQAASRPCSSCRRALEQDSLSGRLAPLLALSPRDFLDAAGRAAQRQDAVRRGRLVGGPPRHGWVPLLPGPPGDLHESPGASGDAAAAQLPGARLAPTEPIAFAGRGGDATAYWVDTNRLTLALERPVVKPGRPATSSAASKSPTPEP